VRTPGLKARVSLTFGLLTLLVSLVISIATYGFARVYLTEQRENAAVVRTQLDARAVDTELQSSTDEVPTTLETLPSAGTQKMLRIGSTWYSSGISVSPDDLPAALAGETGETEGGRQRFRVGDTLYLAVAVPVTGGVYLEVFSLAELERTLALVGWALAGSAVGAFVLGVALGRYASGRLLRPLRRLVTSANTLAAGDLSVRMGPTGDPDLQPISTAFDDMAASVEDQIERERRFVANVSHELRTPVTVVLGTAEILSLRASRLPEEEARLLRLLAEQSERLGRTVIDLLELGAAVPASDVSRETTDVAGLTRQVLIEHDLDPALLAVNGAVSAFTDPRRLERILANLVENAESHGGGLRRISIDDDPDADTVTLVVDDSGPGVPIAERESIFEPFNRGETSEPGSGSGLGLAIVREQVQTIGAQVAIEDAPGGGARFAVTLPRSGS
jgi:signal transduction histidine kinase